MDATTSSARDSVGREIVITRLIDAPCDLVFEAWTDAKHLAAWWGPTGFTATTSASNMRPGGVLRFVMHGPDGRDYQNRITCDEIGLSELSTAMATVTMSSRCSFKRR